MKRLFLSVLILFTFFLVPHAQRRSRGLVNESKETQGYLFLSIGPEFCFADPTASPYSQSLLKNNNFTLGYRKLYPNNLGYKFEVSCMNFTGNDTVSLSSIRRYSFHSQVLKAAFMGEYSIILGRRYYYRSTPSLIYGFLGAGVLRSIANLNCDPANIVDNYTYKRIYNCPVIPFGGGYRYNFNNGFLLGFEVNYNYTFSDYIDGFKPPSVGSKKFSKSNDIFGGISLTFSYLLGSEYLNRK
jgi:hypothetical protein